MPISAIRDYLLPINPVTGCHEIHIIPAFVEKFVGASSYTSLIDKSGGEIKENHENPKYQEYVRLVQEVGTALAKQAKRQDIKFEFKVINNDKDNAWCLPGGKIGINVGLIERMEKENLADVSLSPFSLKEKIAAVLSHEIVHADARHTGRSLEFRLFLIGIIKAAQLFVVHHWVHRSYISKIEEATRKRNEVLLQKLQTERDAKAKSIGTLFEMTSSWLIKGICLCNSRSNELESDRFGMRMIRDLSKANIDGFQQNSPQAAIWLQSYFEKHHSYDTKINFLNRALNFFSTHPSPQERLEANKQTWLDLQAGKL
jgi:predicted Zn-dependent protease